MDAEDGVIIRPDTIQAAEIRKEANYAGVRVTLLGLIDGARCPIQIDIGFGDVVTPGPEEVRYPVMLPDFQAPKLQVYPRYTVVAEKLEAGIEIPFPYRTLTLRGDVPVQLSQVDSLAGHAQGILRKPT